MLINIMNVMLWGLNPNEEPADDDNGDAKSDLFEYAIPASLKYLEGKLIHRGSELHIHAPSDDEVYSISHATLPVPTSQTYEWWNADGGDVMPYINFSSSSGPSPYRLPLEKESSGGSARGRLGLSAANSLNHHALETSNQPHETNFRNPLSLVDSLEPEDATGGIIMSDSTFGTEYEASISDLFGDRGTDLLADEDLPLAHSRSGTVASQEQTAEIVEIVASEPVAETEQRRNRHGRFNCPLCARTFTMTSTMMYHLRSKSPTLQIFVALLLMSVRQAILKLISVTEPTQALIVRLHPKRRHFDQSGITSSIETITGGVDCRWWTINREC